MTAKEKAAQLVAIYSDFEFNPLVDAKRCAKDCALINVNEIIKSNPVLEGETAYNTYFERKSAAIEYWQQVKNEIEIL